MVQSKAILFEESLQHDASFFKALSHPARLAILKYLSEIKACMTGDITEVLPLGRTTVNQHLTELRNAGLIRGEIEGSKTKYCLNDKIIKEQIKNAQLFFQNLEKDINLYC